MGWGCLNPAPFLTRVSLGTLLPSLSLRLLQPLTSMQTARRLMAGGSLWMWSGAGP